MKVALSFPGCHRRGGVERVFVECLNFLARQGHEIHAFASEWDHSVLQPEVRCHDISSHAFLAAGRVNRFRQASAAAIAKLQPDVVGSFGVAAPPGSVVWMQSVHAAWLDVCRRTRSPRERLKQCLNPFHATIVRAEREMLVGRSYRRLVALTPQVRDDLAKYYGVPAKDVDVLPNGYSQAEFNPDNRQRDRTEMRRRLALPDEAKVVAFVANESERKGLSQLLRAIAKLNDPTLHVLAVGRFDPKPVLRLANSLGLGSRLRLPGASARVALYYAAADVFALPTQYEAWGLVIVEALACGLPVLTSRLAGAAVAVCENITGELLDEPRDEVEIAAKLTTLLNRLDAVNAQMLSHSVARYEWAQVLQSYDEILRDCSAGVRSPSNTATPGATPKPATCHR